MCFHTGEGVMLKIDVFLRGGLSKIDVWWQSGEGGGFKKPEKLTTSFMNAAYNRMTFVFTEFTLLCHSFDYVLKANFHESFCKDNNVLHLVFQMLNRMMIWLGTNWSSYFLSGNWWTNSFWLALEIHHGYYIDCIVSSPWTSQVLFETPLYF